MAAMIPQTVMEERWCEFCAMTGRKSLMQPHKPLRDHYYCSSCGHVEIDWPPILSRVKATILYEYPFAKARLAALPSAPVARYDAPYVDGGLAVSQQEAHVLQEQQDHWVVRLVESLFRCGLTRGERNVIVSLYFERYSYRATAERLQIAKSTVEKWEEEALKKFARAARWA